MFWSTLILKYWLDDECEYHIIDAYAINNMVIEYRFFLCQCVIGFSLHHHIWPTVHFLWNFRSLTFVHLYTHSVNADWVAFVRVYPRARLVQWSDKRRQTQTTRVGTACHVCVSWQWLQDVIYVFLSILRQQTSVKCCVLVSVCCW